MSRTFRRNPNEHGVYHNRYRYRIEDGVYVYGDGTEFPMTSFDWKRVQGRDGCHGLLRDPFKYSPSGMGYREYGPGACRRSAKKEVTRLLRNRNKAVVREHLRDYIADID